MREEERQTAASVTKHTLTTNGTQNKQKNKKTGQGKQTFTVVCVRERDMCELVKNLLDNLTS